jgi:hypothetical protein
MLDAGCPQNDERHVTMKRHVITYLGVVVLKKVIGDAISVVKFIG